MNRSQPRRGLQLARFIRDSRELLCLTQEELARKLRLSSPEIVSHWENGSYGISRGKLEKLSTLVNLERGRYKHPKPLVRIGSCTPKFDQLWKAVQRADQLRRRISANG